MYKRQPERRDKRQRKDRERYAVLTPEQRAERLRKASEYKRARSSNTERLVSETLEQHAER